MPLFKRAKGSQKRGKKVTGKMEVRFKTTSNKVEVKTSSKGIDSFFKHHPIFNPSTWSMPTKVAVGASLLIAIPFLATELLTTLFVLAGTALVGLGIYLIASECQQAASPQPTSR